MLYPFLSNSVWAWKRLKHSRVNGNGKESLESPNGAVNVICSSFYGLQTPCLRIFLTYIERRDLEKKEFAFFSWDVMIFPFFMWVLWFALDYSYALALRMTIRNVFFFIRIPLKFKDLLLMYLEAAFITTVKWIVFTN